MKYQKGLIQKNLRILQEKEWYHQRFDGCPQFILLISEAEMRPERRKLKGGNFTSHIVFFKNDRVDWYIDQEDIKRITNLVIKASLKNQKISKDLIKKWKRDEKIFYDYCRRLKNINLDMLSNERLKHLYHDFVEVYCKTVTNSSVIDGFALGTDRIIQEKITNFLKSKRLQKYQYRYFTRLTAPTSQSFINEAEISLLKVVQLINRTKAIKRLVLREKSIDQILKELKQFKRIYQALKQHQKSYFWSKNNYVDDNVLDLNHFTKEIKGILRGKVNITKEINRISSTPIKNKISKDKLIKRLKPPRIIRNLITISGNFTDWQDERKRKTYWLTHCLSLIINEIAKRFDYSLHGIKYLVPPEVENLFTKKRKITLAETRARIRKSLFYQKGQNYEILSGNKAEKLRKVILRKKREEVIHDFRGLPACRGKVRGKVKIIKSAREAGKVEKGNILVAVMTRPDYIVGIKKAAAIVTDEGGVTCHAAIVSRELSIPCVIGTKIATKVLKDGDYIDVNASHGIITIIKRK